MSDPPGMSVIVCCHNSELRIESTLSHLALQKVQDTIIWEVIVVNNNSTDNTADKAIEVWKRCNSSVPLMVVHEEIAGLTNARIRGVANASYEYLLFCDDDNWMQNNYIAKAYEILAANKNIGILSGQSKGYFETPQPDWFKNVEAAYAIGKPLQQTGIADQRKYLAGACMVTRKSIFLQLESISFQPILVGRTGALLSSGEDAELCLAILFLGYNLYYDESLRFTHYMPKNRLQWQYCVSMCANHAKPQIYFYLYEYAYKNILADTDNNFETAYFKFIIKHIKSLLRNGKNLSGLLKTIQCLLFSSQGSLLEIDTKKKLSKIVFAVCNKKKIKSDFAIICQQLEKIIALSKNNKSVA